MRFAGKTVVLCVTGGIAAYKAADLTSKLHQNGAEVRVLMTESATQFISPMTFETLSCNRTVVDTFDRNFPWEVEHISLAKAADVFVIAPATANIIAKAAHGIADDMVSTTLLATKAPVVIAPAMNTGMYDNPVTQENLKTLRARGFHIIEPAAGHLACGDSGRGKLPDTATLLWGIEKALTAQDLAGKTVLVTAGPTQEAMDPVRFLSNHSTGKMGYAIAERAAMRGAEVTLVSGPTALDTPKGVRRVDIKSARDMYDAVLSRADEQDFIIKAAAVGDYRPAETASEKLKKGDGELRMSPDMREAVDVFTTFMYEGVYYNPIAKGEERKVQNILGSIWEYYVNHIDELPVVYQSIADDEGPQRAVCDYVSGMTDSYALEVYSELFIPAAWTIK